MVISDYSGHVYVDIVFLINLTMDYIILWTTAKVGRFQTNWWRLIFGAFIGASYSLVTIMPDLQSATTLFAKFICSLFMVIVAFFPFAFRNVLQRLLYFYLISFVLGGAIMGFIYMTNQNPVYVQAWNGAAVVLADISYHWLFIGLLTSIIMVYSVAQYLRKNWQKSSLQNSVTICLDGRTVTVNSYLDTGNQLFDPISKRPVIIVESRSLNNIFPDIVKEMLESKDGLFLQKDFNLLPQNWRSKIQIIPFSSIGKNNGLLVALRPDWITINYGTDEYKTNQVLIGVYNQKLSKDGNYQALLHPDLLEKIIIKQ